MRENQGFSICFLTNVSHMITSDLRPSTTTKRKRFLENDTVGNVGNQDKDGKGLLTPSLITAPKPKDTPLPVHYRPSISLLLFHIIIIMVILITIFLK